MKKNLLFRVCAWLFFLTTLQPIAQAQSLSTKLEHGLILAMSFNNSTGERLADSGWAIRQYIDSKHVARKPDSRWDYIDFRILQKPAYLMGQQIIVIEEEYFDFWIGCCVSPGIGVVLKVQSDISELHRFAKANNCSIKNADEAIETLTELGLSVVTRDYVGVSCRERDISN